MGEKLLQELWPQEELSQISKCIVELVWLQNRMVLQPFSFVSSQ